MNEFKGFMLSKRDKTYSQDLVTYFILAIIAFVMGLVNLIKSEYTVMIVVFAFAILCLVNILLNKISEKLSNFALVIFSIEVACLFTYFIISGAADGFSILWMALLPAFGMLKFGPRDGTILSLVMFFVLIFFLWIPVGRNLCMYEYTDAFRLRFLFFYLASNAISIYIEALRFHGKMELTKAKEEYMHLSKHDPLTNSLNRNGFNDYIEDAFKNENDFSLAMIDIDSFKHINDTYGHINGDKVLNEFVRVASEVFKDCTICRWGGDEFLVLFKKELDAKAICDELINRFVDHHIDLDGNDYVMYISIGLLTNIDKNKLSFEKALALADKNLYIAKEEDYSAMLCTAYTDEKESEE